MEKVKIDFLKEKYQINEKPRKRVLFFRRAFLVIIVFSAISASVFSYQVNSTGDSNGAFPKLSILSTIRGLVNASDNELLGEEDDRVNLLLLGIGGEGHNGPQLTDTIIFSSFKPSTKEVGMISVPRDLTVPIPGHGWRKINHANAFGEEDGIGQGPKLASEVIEKIFDQKIHYYLRVDFDGFEELIDDISGIDIYVGRSFTDAKYPTHGKEYAECGDQEIAENENEEEIIIANYDCRFEALSFQEGWTHMNGDTALKYVRSRHGTNGESSDFARSRRQQKVLAAVKDKVFSARTFLNPARINRILKTLESHIATNLNTWELIRLAKDLRNINTETIAHHVLDNSPSSPLYSTSLNGAYVLLPKNDDWRPLEALAQNIFSPDSSTAFDIDDPDNKPLFVKVEIQNGTNTAGLAFHTSQLLDGQGFDVVKIGNASDRNYEQTIVYDLTNGQRPDELKALQNFFKADVTLTATGWMMSGDVIPKEISLSSEDYESLSTEDNIDFLIILGENSANLVRR